MIFRTADINDLEELVRIRIAYLNEDHHGLSQEQLNALQTQLPGYFKEHLGKDIYVYIAEEGGKVISSVFLLVIEKPANPSFITGRIGNILNVYTKPEFRRRGLAGGLMRMAIDDAKGMQLSYLELKATKAGYPLYKKMGFDEVKSEYVLPMKLLL